MKNALFILFITLLSPITLAQNTMQFTAEITNRNADIIYIKTPDGKTFKEIKINPKDVFQDTFEVKEGLYILFDSSEYTLVYLKNGFDLNLKMDAKQFDESIIYSGKGAIENNYLAQKSLVNEEYQEKLFAIQEEKAFSQLLLDFKSKLQEKLKTPEMDANFKSVAEKLIASESAEMQMQFAETQKKQKLAGTLSPSFDYLNHAGGKTKLEDLRGKYVYIDVWATWCGPCRAEIPSLKKIEEKYHGKNIVFVSISVDENKDFEKWKKFVSDKALGGIQLFADKNWNSDFMLAYGINSIPRFILIDPQGNILNPDMSRPSSPELQKKLDALLN